MVGASRIVHYCKRIVDALPLNLMGALLSLAARRMDILLFMNTAGLKALRGHVGRTMGPNYHFLTKISCHILRL
jgi:hypothetical protein